MDELMCLGFTVIRQVRVVRIETVIDFIGSAFSSELRHGF